MRKMYMLFLCFALAIAFTNLPVVNADINAANKVAELSLLPATKSGNLFLGKEGIFNLTLRPGTNYLNTSGTTGTFYSINFTNQSAYATINVTNTVNLAYGYNTLSNNVTVGLWTYTAPGANNGTDKYIMKWGAGTAAFVWVDPYSFASTWYADMKNTTGSSNFANTGLTPPTGQWVLRVMTMDSLNNIYPWMCTYGQPCIRGNNISVNTGFLRVASNDTRIIGSDGGASSMPFYGQVAGFMFINTTLSLDQIQAIADLGPNWEQDNITGSITFSSSLGVMNSTFGLRENAWAAANYSAENPHNPRADCNGSGSENCNVTQGNFSIANAIISNMTSPLGKVRVELDGSSIRDGSGNLKACSQSDFGSICMLTSAVTNNRLANRKTIVTILGIDADLQTSNGVCTADNNGYVSNLATFSSRRATELDLIGCGIPMDDGSASCEVEIWNEGDISNFFCSNVSSRQDTRLTAMMWNITNSTIQGIRNYTNSTNATRSNTIRNLTLIGMPLANVNTTDQVYWRTSWLGNASSNNWPTTLNNAHLYGKDYWSNGAFMYELIGSATTSLLNTCTAVFGSSESRCYQFYYDEWDTGNTTNQNAASGTNAYLFNQVQIAAFELYALQHPEYNFTLAHYQGTDWSNLSNASNNNACGYPYNHCAFIHPQVVASSGVYQSPYNSLWKMQAFNLPGSTRYTAQPNTSTVSCTAGSLGNNYTLTCVNNGYNYVNSTWSVTGLSITGVTNVESGSSFSATNGVFTLTDLTPLDVNVYTFGLGGIGFNVTNPSPLTNITEPNNQTFNYTLLNATGIQTNSNWTLNGTLIATDVSSYTFTGNYTTQGLWNITVNVNSTTNSITYSWILNVTNNNSQISYNTTTPSSGVASIVVGQSQAFSFTINNQDNISTNTQWFSNGTNVSACYDLLTCSFTGATTGTFNISTNTTSSVNNISTSWLLTISSAASTATICSANNNGIQVFAQNANTIGMIIVLFIIVGLLASALGWVSFDFSATQIVIGSIVMVVIVVVISTLVAIVQTSC